MGRADQQWQDDGTFKAQIHTITDTGIADAVLVLGPGDSLFGQPFEQLMEGWITEK